MLWFVNVAEETTTPLQDEIRRTMRASGDPRAMRTRQAIMDAVHALITEGESTPTVSQIVRRAGMSRSSFYTQFANMNELAAAVFRQAFTQVETADLAARRHGLAGAEATQTAVERLVRHVDEHRDFYRHSFPATFAAHNEAVQALAAQLRESIPLVSSPPAGVSVDATAIYIAGGTLAILRAWVVGEVTGSVTDITNQIMALLPVWLVSPDQFSSVPSEKGE
jgi:AcrR family transcriptional regulator